MSSINSSYYICGDFSIHVDVPVGGYKCITFLDLCDMKQLVNQPTHLHGHILDFILSPNDQDTIADITICDFVSDHTLVKCSIAFPHIGLIFQIKFNIEGTNVSTCLTSAQISKILPSSSLQLML